VLSSAAGGLQPLVPVASPETHQPQTGPVALLGMGPAAQDLDDYAAGGLAGLLRPADQPTRPVAWPVFSAQRISREGVHSACARCALGMCSVLVAG